MIENTALLPVDLMRQYSDRGLKESFVGKYVPFKKGRQQRSLQDALNEAEEDHFVDCPDAPYLLRLAAFILDGIFILILISSFNRLATALLFYLGYGLPANAPVLFRSFMIASDVTMVYLYSLWTVHRFGATPSKLIFNLQIVDSDSGRKLEFYQILIREIVGKTLGILLLGAGFWLPFLRKDKKTLHDLLSSSSVKKVDEASR